MMKRLTSAMIVIIHIAYIVCNMSYVYTVRLKVNKALEFES